MTIFKTGAAQWEEGGDSTLLIANFSPFSPNARALLQTVHPSPVLVYLGGQDSLAQVCLLPPPFRRAGPLGAQQFRPSPPIRQRTLPSSQCLDVLHFSAISSIHLFLCDLF